MNPDIDEFQQSELEMYLIEERLLHRIHGLPKDYVFDLMNQVHIGGWYNLMFDVLVSNENKAKWE